MSPQNKKETIENILRGKTADRIPFTIFQCLVPIGGEAELNLRNNGLSLINAVRSYKSLVDNIEITEKTKYSFGEKDGIYIIDRIYTTPCGEITTQHQFKINNSMPEPSDLILKNEHSLEQLSNSWIKKYAFTKESDYELLEYFYNNIEYVSNEEEYLRISALTGSEGIIMAMVDWSPFQTLLYKLMGPERCYFEYHDNRKKFLSLYNLISERQKEKYALAAKLPALAVWVPENITASMTTPDFFKEFCMPFYSEVADILHKKDKIFVAHMDGLLKPLAELISKSDIDVIEAFTPVPMGDLSILDARSVWKNKIIWMNYPGTIIVNNDLNVIREYTKDILKSIAPGDRFLIGCTENFPLENWEESFGEILKVLKEYGQYPISF